MAEENAHLHVTAAPAWPMLIYDGDCGFCRAWIARWRALTGERVEYAPSQEVAARFPEIPPERFKRAVQFIAPDGTVSSGAEAVFQALACAPGRGWPLWLYRHAPVCAKASERAYQFVASHRTGLSRVTGWLWGRHLEPSTFVASRWIFLRALALIYLIAFVSLWSQIDGLIGKNGILPASLFLQRVRAIAPADYFWKLPTLCWLDGSDAALHALCGAGAAFSVLLFFNCAPVFCLAALWGVYLSLTNVGQAFLSFQWDNLLLETGLLAIFIAPFGVRPGAAKETSPSAISLWLLKFLLFRLMFSSGVVKLLSGDATWWKLSALHVHYETQPLPAWTSWYMHHFPPWFHAFSCAAMFFIELVVPFLIFWPRRVRHFAAGLLILLQVIISLTGNYTFFNLLTATLCIPLLDDFVWPEKWRAWLERGTISVAGRWRWRNGLLMPIAIVLAVLGMVTMLQRWNIAVPELASRCSAWAGPFRSVSGYGLFANMTTKRPEIVIEGSDDGEKWLEYGFKYKAGDLRRRPCFIAPHQPRLDWQMWFAALGNARSTPWFLNLLQRILEGSPQVLGLLETNPFPEKPPRYIRAVLYEYHFSDAASAAKDGVWWSRARKGFYVPPVSLK